MDYEVQLKKLKEDLDKAKTLKYRAEAKLEQLKNQEKDLIDELVELGVNPNNLDNEIRKLSEEINSLFEEASKLLPKDILD